MGVRGDELGLTDASSRVNDGVGSRESMIDARVRGGDGDCLVHRDNPAVKRLGDEAVGERAAAVLGEMFVDFVDDQRRHNDRRFVLEIVAEGGGLRVVGHVLEPAGRIDDE